MSMGNESNYSFIDRMISYGKISRTILEIFQSLSQKLQELFFGEQQVLAKKFTYHCSKS